MTVPDSLSADTPTALRRLDTAGATALADLAATFEDLQTVLRCCERLVAALAADAAEPDDVLVEAVWTMALLSYARCFTAGSGGVALAEADVSEALSHGEVLDWHRVLLELREHYCDPAANPRERFSVGVAYQPGGTADGIAITSARQPLVDDVTVRQTGAIAFALSRLVDTRISAKQGEIFGELKDLPVTELDLLPELDVERPSPAG